MTTSLRPEDTDDTIHLFGKDHTLADIIDACFDKWNENIEMHDITISSLHFHARCIGYDLYDAGDYDDYLVIEYRPS